MISRSNRYERWDGSQEPFGRDAEELFDRLAEDLFQGGDFDYALHRLMSRGWRDKQGRRLPGFEEMLERLRQKRPQQLKRYNLKEHDAHHAAAAARRPGRDQGNEETPQSDAARSARGQAPEVRAVHAAFRPFLRPRPAEDAR